MSEFELVIDGVAGEIDVSALTTMLHEGQKLLRSVADENIRCTIGHLSVGSAHASIVAPDRPISIVVDGLEFLQTHTDIPPGWTRRSLEALQAMESCYNHLGVEDIRLGVDQRFTALEKSLLNNVKQAMPAQRRSLGAVKGRIYSYSNKYGQPTAKLEAAGKGQVVKLVLEKGLIPEVLTCIEQEATVSVRGLLKRDADDQHVSEVEVRDIQQVKVIKPQSPGRFKGILSAVWPDDCDSVEDVRRQRGKIHPAIEGLSV